MAIAAAARCRTFAIEHCNRAALVRLDILTYLFNLLSLT